MSGTAVSGILIADFFFFLTCFWKSSPMAEKGSWVREMAPQLSHVTSLRSRPKKALWKKQ